MKKDFAEKTVHDFFNTIGWENEEGITEDARRWEDLRKHSKIYVSKCRLRLLKFIPKVGENILDMASGPIQYKEYLEYSKNFDKRYCVDLSHKALADAKYKIGDHGKFFVGSFFDLEFKKNFFDCALSLHTIYHMNKNKQEEAVRKLIKITKKGAPIIIIYSNPNTLISKILFPLKVIRNILRKLRLIDNKQALYFYAHNINWWQRFKDEAEITMTIWRSFESKHQKLLFPNNKLGEMMFRLLFKLEEKFPKFFLNNFHYPLIILKKK